MNRLSLSVVILTKNEAEHIRQCLESVAWADERLVIDDESTDNTVALAESLGAKVLRRRMDNEGAHRNWAYAQAKHLWVLSLDADERVTPELAEEIRGCLQSEPPWNGAIIPIQNHLGTHWLRYGGWYPAEKLRLFRKDRFRYEETLVHPRAFMPWPEGRLKGNIIHLGYRDFTECFEKLNRHTTFEARKWVSDGRRASLAEAMRKTLDRFLRAWIRKQGWREGFIGFMMAFYQGWYQWLTYLKYWELTHSQPAGGEGYRETGVSMAGAGTVSRADARDERWPESRASGATLGRSEASGRLGTPTSAGGRQAPVSVVILAKNEAAQLPDCIETVRWAKEILVIDDESTDDTVALAESLGARVLRRRMDNEGRHRNWAYAQASQPWVLSLDADERVTPALQDEIVAAVTNNPKWNGYEIPRKTFIGSRWVRHGGWYPSAQLKLFRKDRFRYEEAEVHPKADVQEGWGSLHEPLWHYSYRDIEDFFATVNRQTSLEATKWHRQGRRMSLAHALWRTGDRKIRAFFLKGGFRDGMLGLTVASFAAFYQLASFAKYRELSHDKNAPAAAVHG
ncbi:MAG: glycosyltransferase family 2 protein [Candidatus Omnitrophica bacterium]|nr:glycosyltransferase family 2 protein [Candidatus Omnitrophota bacterium]